MKISSEAAKILKVAASVQTGQSESPISSDAIVFEPGRNHAHFCTMRALMLRFHGNCENEEKLKKTKLTLIICC